MRVADALAGVQRLFLDTAPVIYLIEHHPIYFAALIPIFQSIREGLLVAVTSPVTLAETLVIPYRHRSLALTQRYDQQIVRGRNTAFVGIDDVIARHAAGLRATYNLQLSDALQAAVALHAGCEALLTNDTVLLRIRELRVIMVNDLEA